MLATPLMINLDRVRREYVYCTTVLTLMDYHGGRTECSKITPLYNVSHSVRPRTAMSRLNLGKQENRYYLSLERPTMLPCYTMLCPSRCDIVGVSPCPLMCKASCITVVKESVVVFSRR